MQDIKDSEHRLSKEKCSTPDLFLLDAKTPSEILLQINNTLRSSEANDWEEGDHAPCWSDYEILEVLGEGSYGKIFKVRVLISKKILVIKQIDTS